MLRLLVIAVLLIVGLLLLFRLVREVRGAKVDWTGWTTAVAFVVLAFYLRHATGLG